MNKREDERPPVDAGRVDPLVRRDWRKRIIWLVGEMIAAGRNADEAAFGKAWNEINEIWVQVENGRW